MKTTGKNAKNKPPQAILSHAIDPYVIQVGDSFDVKIFGYPWLTQYQIVRPDGKVSVEMIGDIQASGLTPKELDRRLTEAYGEIIRNPELAVILRTFGGQTVFVGGKVLYPGEIPLKGRLTALEAIFFNGGPTEEAKLKSVILVRSYGCSKCETKKLDLSETTKTGDGDILLQPNDILYVPQSNIAKVDRFVAQYIHKILPNSMYAKMRWRTDLNTESNETVRAILR